MNNSYGFTEEDFASYRNSNTIIHNTKFREEKETFANAMCSVESDFTLLPNGEEILKLLKQLGE